MFESYLKSRIGEAMHCSKRVNNKIITHFINTNKGDALNVKEYKNYTNLFIPFIKYFIQTRNETVKLRNSLGERLVYETHKSN